MKDHDHKRFYFCTKIDQMLVGHTVTLHRSDAMGCWPPTGDLDYSIGAFMSVVAGSRPDQTMTTMNRIENDIGSDFEVYLDPTTMDYEINRKRVTK